MSTIINATTTNGVVIQPDNSGSLVLQTNSGTTALTIDTSQRAAFVAGTAALPAITTTGDTNTGIFFPAADTIAFAEGGAERMRIDSSGNVGIGTTSPTASNGSGLQISRTGGNATLTLTRTGNTSSDIRSGILALTFNVDPDNAVADSFLQFSVDNTERMRITAGGEVYIAGTTDQGAYNLQCNGTGVWGAGAYVNGSDSRIKDDIQPISSSLEVVNKLNPVTFKYKEDWSKDQSVQTGFIAQELQETLKDEIYIDGLVNTGGEYLSVAYQNIIPLLTKAIQEQQTIINDLKARVETLEAK
jgi:hypothetical protein